MLSRPLSLNMRRVNMARYLQEASNIKDQDQTGTQIEAAEEIIKTLKTVIINILREIRYCILETRLKHYF